MPSLLDFQLRPRIVAGAGSLDLLGRLVVEYGGKRVLVVTDRGLVAAGHVERATASIREAGVQPCVFDDVHENPTTDDVDRCVESARKHTIDFIIGLGGGSALDVAKGCNFVLTNGGRMQDYWGVGRATKAMLPFIAVPTTTGTGSEMQSFALIADAITHQKMACGDRKASAKAAVLDPALTVSQPPFVRACTGMDCIAHAIETAVTTRRNPVSAAFSRESLRLVTSSFPSVLRRADDLDAELDMLFAAAFAGVAIESSMLGAAHALANPLTAQYGVVHGQAVGIMLPHVVACNVRDGAIGAIYADIGRSAGIVSGASDDALAVESLIAWIQTTLREAGLASPLRDFGMSDGGIESLAERAAVQWTATFNPVPVDKAILARLYRAALE